jgi:hypothetical protein
MKPWLSKAAQQLREQTDDCFPDRKRKSDGWIGDLRHSARKSDHNPNGQGEVCAIDIDAGLSEEQGISLYLADQIRQAAKRDKRISYVIHAGKITGAKSLWRWVKYSGINQHHKHIHISFKPNQSGEFFNIPLLGGKNE